MRKIWILIGSLLSTSEAKDLIRSIDSLGRHDEAQLLTIETQFWGVWAFARRISLTLRKKFPRTVSAFVRLRSLTSSGFFRFGKATLAQ